MILSLALVHNSLQYLRQEPYESILTVTIMGYFAMLNLKKITLDEGLAEAGTWFTFMEGAELLIASGHSRKYKADLAKLVRKYKTELDTEDDSANERGRQIFAETMAKHVLLDWKGIGDDDGNAVAYSWEIGKDALLNSPVLREFVEKKALSVEDFSQSVVEQAKKSSPGTTSGLLA